MKVLVIGSGGREHALVWKISQSPKVNEIYCAPGNGGISDMADCVDIDPTSIVELTDFAQQLKIDLTVVGPELPLSLGIADEFIKRGLRVFGARQSAAEIESSKIFAKDLMKKYDIPTADYRVFDVAEDAHKFLESGEVKYPTVVKADGLAAGKGVIICEDKEEAGEAVDTVMVEKKFGSAGNRIIIEGCLKGREASFIVFTDGRRVVPLVASQDHKQLYDGGKGPNTGGMGAFSPAVVLNADLYKSIMKKVIHPTVSALKQEGRKYQGVLYAGLMLTDKGPEVLEFNCRFGDPETQVILPRLKSDIVEVMDAVIDKNLDKMNVEWHKNAATCVVMASGGYPASYEKGYEIKGLDKVGREMDEVVVFHAGTHKKDGKYLTSGGRVLGVTAMGDNLVESAGRAYSAVEHVDFKDKHYRKDIGLFKKRGGKE